MNILLVYELVPEETKLYILEMGEEQVKDGTFDRIKNCHDHFLGVSDPSKEVEDDLVWLSDYLVGQGEVPLKEGDPVDLTDVDLLIYTGMML